MIEYQCKECGTINSVDATYVEAFKGSYNQGADEPPSPSYLEDTPDEIVCINCNAVHTEEWLLNYIEQS